MPIRPFPDPSNPATIAEPVNPQDPTQNPILRSAMKSATALAAKAEVSAAKQEQITAETLSASGLIQDAIGEAAKDKVLIKGVAANAELKAQNAKISTLEAAGGIEFQRELMSAFVEAGKDLIEANKERAESKESIVSSIIDLARKDLGMSTAESRANDAEDRRDDIGETITGINTAQETIVRSVNSSKKVVTVGTIEANADLIQQQAAIDSANAKLASLRDNAAALRAGMSADAAAVQAKIQVVGLKNTAENQQARRVEQAHQEEVFQQRLTEYEANAPTRIAQRELTQLQLLEAKNPDRSKILQMQRDKQIGQSEDDIRFEALFTTNVRAGQTSLGLPVEDAVTIIRQGMKAGTAKERAYYQKLRQTGLREGAAYGNSPADALETISITGADPSLPAASMLIALNQSYLSDKTSKR